MKGFGRERLWRMEEKRVEAEDEWKVMFWNVAGLRNKDVEFWKGLKNWDVIVFSETWVEEKSWDKVRKSLPRGFVWKTQWATRKKKKGRAKGGMIMGIRKELRDRGEELKTEEEGLIEGSVRIGEEKWRIIGVYVKDNIEKYRGRLEKWMEEKRKVKKLY